MLTILNHESLNHLRALTLFITPAPQKIGSKLALYSHFFRTFAAKKQERDMNRHHLPTLLLLLLLAFGCSRQPSLNVQQPASDNVTDSLSFSLEGDSTVYGLACDGCTDTILVFLPIDSTNSDPDTFYILNATKQHRIYGHPNIGDLVAVLRDSTSHNVAQMVVDLEDLCHTWYYQVAPTFRHHAAITAEDHERLLKALPDSVRDSLLAPREYGLTLNHDHTATPHGQYRHSIDEKSLVVYPAPHRYRQWRLYNGNLLLTQTAIDSTGQLRTVGTDTAQILLLRHDTLTLRFGDNDIKGYYGKPEKEKEQ